MTFAERQEAVVVLRAVLRVLVASVRDAAADSAAELRHQRGALDADAPALVAARTYGAPLGACFVAATAAGATLDGMDRVRAAALATASTDDVVQRVAQTAIRFALIEMCRILAATTFTSRQEVEAALARMQAAFEPAEDFAADGANSEGYRALVRLRAATVRDLTARARPLPRMVTFSLPGSMPVLTLAQRLFGDAARASELLAENATAHPLFMPARGRALAR